MIPSVDSVGMWPMGVVACIFAAAIVTALWRLLVGPSLPDRVVALDLLGFLVVALIAVLSIVTAQPALLGVSVVAALILFLGTAAFAIYLERRSAS